MEESKCSKQAENTEYSLDFDQNRQADGIQKNGKKGCEANPGV